ncbi:hypothetical protein ADL12_40590 [Streptomyces regalis]|uniref:Uncharacterized protein n=1 Tax=Streptomyces regalis TaxID=68262 RepID=A0A124G7J4_9ACTN|nr:hypothetical protein ADL12_40590 [Streptomyces regalis]
MVWARRVSVRSGREVRDMAEDAEPDLRELITARRAEELQVASRTRSACRSRARYAFWRQAGRS